MQIKNKKKSWIVKSLVLPPADCLDKSNKFDQCLLKTYTNWKEKQCSTFLAVVRKRGQTGSRNAQTQTIIIGDETVWEDYTNGELNPKVTYK